MKHSYEPSGAANSLFNFPATPPGSSARVESTGCAAQRSTRGISSRARRLPDDFPVCQIPVGDRGLREVATPRETGARRRRKTGQQKARFLRDTGANKTGFLGVKWIERLQRYYAYIRDKSQGGRKVYAGSGKTAEEAARAYDRKARELYGAGAVVNFPDTSRAPEAVTL